MLNTNGFVLLLKFTMIVTIIVEKFKNTCNVFSINFNTSLDVLTLHTEIINLKNAAVLSFDAADNADKIIHGLRSVFPSWSSFKNGLYSLIILALLVLGILLFPPIAYCDKTCL